MKKFSLPPFVDNIERSKRLDDLRQVMKRTRADATVITPGSSMRYFFGEALYESERFVGAVITGDQVVFVCPKFEDTALIAKLPMKLDMAYWEEHESPYTLIGSILAGARSNTCLLDPNCSYGHAAKLFQALSGLNAPIKYESADRAISGLRAQKSAVELELMKAAKLLTLEVHKSIFSWIKPGMAASEVIAKIDALHRQGGADNGSSFCAVQFGEATAHPHGVPGDPVLQARELILIDTGCTVDGYNSDITRTYALDHVEQEIEKLWCVEKEAQQAAFNLAAPGIACENVDKAARDVLISHGLGPDYNLPGLPHRTGHGIGLDIHEGPYLVKGDNTPLAPGMCFSNEPMIVVPGRFGIRLEDHFFITPTGAEWFTQPQDSLYCPFG